MSKQAQRLSEREEEVQMNKELMEAIDSALMANVKIVESVSDFATKDFAIRAVAALSKARAELTETK